MWLYCVNRNYIVTSFQPTPEFICLMFNEGCRNQKNYTYFTTYAQARTYAEQNLEALQ